MRFAIIGTGAIGQEHLRNLLLMSERERRSAPTQEQPVSVAALCDSTPQSLEWAKMTLGMVPLPKSLEWARMTLGDEPNGGKPIEFLSDYRELFDRNDDDDNNGIDAVIVCTPNFHHVKLMEELFEAAKKSKRKSKRRMHVLCEKPLCTTVADCLKVRELVKEAERGDVGDSPLFWVGMEYRYGPSVSRLIAEADSGRVGDVRMVSIREHRFPFLKKVGDWNRLKRNTGDTLVEKCCHFFDLMMRIAGPDHMPTRVYASGGQDVNHKEEVYAGERADIVDAAYALVDFDNGGPRMLLELCMFAEASKNQEEVSVVGTKGKLEAFVPAHQRKTDDDEGGEQSGKTPNFRVGLRKLPWVDAMFPPEPAEVQEFYQGADADVLGAGYHEGATYFELEDFVRQARLTNGGAPTVNVDDGLMAVALGEAAHRSIETGLPVEVASLVPGRVLAEIRAERAERRLAQLQKKRLN